MNKTKEKKKRKMKTKYTYFELDTLNRQFMRNKQQKI